MIQGGSNGNDRQTPTIPNKDHSSNESQSPYQQKQLQLQLFTAQQIPNISLVIYRICKEIDKDI